MTGLLCFPCVINHPAQVEMTGILCFPCVINHPPQVEMTGVLCFLCVINHPAPVEMTGLLCFPCVIYHPPQVEMTGVYCVFHGYKPSSLNWNDRPIVFSMPYKPSSSSWQAYCVFHVQVTVWVTSCRWTPSGHSTPSCTPPCPSTHSFYSGTGRVV